jgi:hypothetical protein
MHVSHVDERHLCAGSRRDQSNEREREYGGKPRDRMAQLTRHGVIYRDSHYESPPLT